MDIKYFRFYQIIILLFFLFECKNSAHAAYNASDTSSFRLEIKYGKSFSYLKDELISQNRYKGFSNHYELGILRSNNDYQSSLNIAYYSAVLDYKLNSSKNYFFSIEKSGMYLVSLPGQQFFRLYLGYASDFSFHFRGQEYAVQLYKIPYSYALFSTIYINAKGVVDLTKKLNASIQLQIGVFSIGSRMPKIFNKNTQIVSFQTVNSSWNNSVSLNLNYRITSKIGVGLNMQHTHRIVSPTEKKSENFGWEKYKLMDFIASVSMQYKF